LINVFPEANTRIWLCTIPTDMRKTYNGLSAMVKIELHENPLNGNLYAFVNLRRNQMKILFFDRNGYVIWSKRHWRRYRCILITKPAAMMLRSQMQWGGAVIPPKNNWQDK